MLLLYLIVVPEICSDNSSFQDILWNFCRLNDKKKRLTLKENPHFYAGLPTLLMALGDGVEIDPTEDFQHEDVFYVLTDKQEPVHIMTNNKILHSFGNLWRSENGIILKGLSIFFFPPVSDFLTDICGRLRGEGIVKASLRGTYYGFYTRFHIERPLVSTSVPKASGTRNHHQLQPIVTELYPWTGWECFIDSPPMDSCVDFCSVCIFTKQVAPSSPVSGNIVTH